jgi:hypothetical protein
MIEDLVFCGSLGGDVEDGGYREGRDGDGY